MTGTQKRRVFVLLSALSVAVASAPSWLEERIEDEDRQLRRITPIATRRLHSLAEESCAEDAQTNEDNLEDIGLECECKDRKEGIVLICMDECAYCNEKQTVCGIQSAQALYDEETGDRTAIGGVFQYVTGFHDTLAIENVGCESEGGQIVSCETCNVYVSGEECNSCELMDCGNGGQAEMIDCENIERGATFNFCEDVTIDDDSVFISLTTSGEFEECLPLDVLGSKKSKKGSKKGGKKGKGKGGTYQDYVLFGGGEPSKSAKKAKSRRRGLL
jgi:hypothetical protein